MSNYTKTTNFGAKDTLPSGDSQKIIRGTEFDTEFNNVATAIATKLEVDGSNNLAISGTFSSTKLIPTGGTATGNGMYLPAANAVAISTNGTERLRIDSSGVASFASNPILNGGTANGLVYLDGSKVATSGSAVTFDGTNLATTGTASATKLIPTGGTATGNGMYLPAANTLALSTNGTERVRVDSSGNLGIGTSSPTTILDVSSSGTTTLRVNRLGVADVYLTAGANGIYGLDTASTNLYFGVSNSLKMTLDSSGNLGLGVTPSAWNSSFKAVQSSAGSIVSQGTTNFRLWHNSYIDSGASIKYINTASAAGYEMAGSEHRFYTAPSGTAGNAITFTQAMTLDASGNLGVGSTAPVGYSGYSGVTIQNTNGGFINLRNAANTNQMEIAVEVGNAGYVKTVTSIPLIFGTNNTERARITSGGDFLVGTTTLAGAAGISFQTGGTTGLALINNNNAAATGYVFSSFRRSGVEIGSITQNGTTAVLFNTTSDRRLKENIVSAPSASDVIDAIEIVSHDWKAAPDEHVTYGVIAQDLALVAPQAVLQGDNSDEIEKVWGVDYSKLVPILIKELQSLRARVATLENN
jgi:hypothetical protein